MYIYIYICYMLLYMYIYIYKGSYYFNDSKSRIMVLSCCKEILNITKGLT